MSRLLDSLLLLGLVLPRISRVINERETCAVLRRPVACDGAREIDRLDIEGYVGRVRRLDIRRVSSWQDEDSSTTRRVFGGARDSAKQPPSSD